MRLRTRASVSPRQSPSSLIRASISREGEALSLAFVAALLRLLHGDCRFLHRRFSLARHLRIARRHAVARRVSSAHQRRSRTRLRWLWARNPPAGIAASLDGGLRRFAPNPTLRTALLADLRSRRRDLLSRCRRLFSCCCRRLFSCCRRLLSCRSFGRPQAADGVLDLVAGQLPAFPVEIEDDAVGVLELALEPLVLGRAEIVEELAAGLLRLSSAAPAGRHTGNRNGGCRPIPWARRSRPRSCTAAARD